jgi:3-oxoacyl-[acyl-carrier protein] reductase
MTKLAIKVALVTGGSRGIGAAIAKRLAADGASVAITYAEDAHGASEVVKAIELNGGKAVSIQADATDSKAVQAAVQKAVATFGQLDVLVNNAGTAIPKPFEETTLEEMDHVFAINVHGTMAATQAALKHMKKRTLTPGLVAYSVAKGAIKMFTQGLSREVGERVTTVNNVQLGPIDTELNPAAGDWAIPQPSQRSIATGMWMRWLHRFRSLPDRSPPISPGRI